MPSFLMCSSMRAVQELTVLQAGITHFPDDLGFLFEKED